MFWWHQAYAMYARDLRLTGAAAALLVSTTWPGAHAEPAEVVQGESFTTVFGPQRYTRVAGPTQTFSADFERCATGDCRLVVENGSPAARTSLRPHRSS
jgi:hypothetical protein